MHTSIYATKTPTLLSELVSTPEMQRLSDIGMHCGCEYADFPIYRRERLRYTRLLHSIGVANIVWHFSGDIKQAVAGLLHDIATPAFAHTIDFFNNDHIRQESTENNTLLFIRNSKSITALLDKYDIQIEDISDYHKYPIADNDTPKLCADRLEYTLGNGYIIHNIDLCEIQSIYDDLVVAKNEHGTDELCFKSVSYAKKFVEISLQNSYWYVSDEDRFAMQYLADTIGYAVRNNALSLDDLFTTESHVIQKLKSNAKTLELWSEYIKISAVAAVKNKVEHLYCVNIPAKKRYIDPLVLDGNGTKRISELDLTIKDKIEDFLSLDFDKWIYSCSV